MQETDAPLCLRHAREEVLMALSSINPDEANLHRKLADNYVIEALRDIQSNPERIYDWSLLQPNH